MLPFDRLEAAIAESVDCAENLSILDPETHEVMAALRSWARELYVAGLSLRETEAVSQLPGSTLAIAPEVRNVIARSALPSECLALELLSAGGEMIRESYSRLVEDIVPLVLDASLTEFAWRYLRRVSRLYIWGFSPEVYVMCRATLDAVLQDRLPEDEVKAALGSTNKRMPVALGQRVQLARFCSPCILDERRWTLAFHIKEDGNDIIHEDVDHHLYFATPLASIAALREILVNLPASDTPVLVRPLRKDAAWRPPAV